MFASYANLSRDRRDWLALSHGLAMLDEEGDLARKVSHSLRQIRDLRGYNQDSWIFHLLLAMLYLVYSRLAGDIIPKAGKKWNR